MGMQNDTTPMKDDLGVLITVTDARTLVTRQSRCWEFTDTRGTREEGCTCMHIRQAVCNSKNTATTKGVCERSRELEHGGPQSGILCSGHMRRRWRRRMGRDEEDGEEEGGGSSLYAKVSHIHY